MKTQPSTADAVKFRLYGQTISVIDVSTNTNLATIKVGFKPGYAAYNATAIELWVTNATNGKVAYYMNMG